MMNLKKISLFFVLGMSTFSFGQTLGRQSLNSFGNTVGIDGIYISQTVGQSGNIQHSSDGNSPIIYQGYQQPISSGIIQSDKDLKFSVYPNPTNGNFFVELGENYTEITATLLDLQGRLIYRKEILNPSKKISFDYTLAEGVYSLQLTTQNEKSGIVKIIILH